MTATEIHLALNHLPVLGTLIGIILLSIGLGMKNKTLNITALAILLVAGLSAFPVNQSGEEAEHVVEEYPGVSHEQIHEHEELAETVLPVSLVMGFLAAIGIFFQLKSHPRARIAAISVLIIALCNFVLIANLAHEGGKIRRPDLRGEISVEAEQYDED